MTMDDTTIKRLEIREGETLAVMCDRPMSAEQSERLTTYVRERIPAGCKVLVLDKGMTVAVVAAQPAGFAPGFATPAGMNDEIDWTTQTR